MRGLAYSWNVSTLWIRSRKLGSSADSQTSTEQNWASQDSSWHSAGEGANQSFRLCLGTSAFSLKGKHHKTRALGCACGRRGKETWTFWTPTFGSLYFYQFLFPYLFSSTTPPALPLRVMTSKLGLCRKASVTQTLHWTKGGRAPIHTLQLQEGKVSPRLFPDPHLLPPVPLLWPSPPAIQCPSAQALKWTACWHKYHRSWAGRLIKLTVRTKHF